MAAPRGRGTVFWLGTASIAVGLALLAYVGWQFVGTNVVARHQQRQLVARTERLWARSSIPASSASLSSSRPSAHVTDVDQHGVEALIRIPTFGPHYVMPVQEGVSAEVLAEGFGHFSGTARAGQVGNFAVAAHRVTHGQPLRDMPALRPGDLVVVQTRVRTYTYRLDTDPNRLVVPLSDVWVISRTPHNPDGGVQPAQRPGRRLITMTTCSELFHTDNRMIVFGHLVSSTPS